MSRGRMKKPNRKPGFAGALRAFFGFKNEDEDNVQDDILNDDTGLSPPTENSGPDIAQVPPPPLTTPPKAQLQETDIQGFAAGFPQVPSSTAGSKKHYVPISNVPRGYGSAAIELPTLSTEQMKSLLDASLQVANDISNKLESDYQTQKAANTLIDGETRLMTLNRNLKTAIDGAISVANTQKDNIVELPSNTARLIGVVLAMRNDRAAKSTEAYFRKIDGLLEAARQQQPNQAAASSSIDADPLIYKTMRLTPAKLDQEAYDRFELELENTKALHDALKALISNNQITPTDGKPVDDAITDLRMSGANSLVAASDAINRGNPTSAEINAFKNAHTDHFIKLGEILDKYSTVLEHPTLKRMLNPTSSATTSTRIDDASNPSPPYLGDKQEKDPNTGNYASTSSAFLNPTDEYKGAATSLDPKLKAELDKQAQASAASSSSAATSSTTATDQIYAVPVITKENIAKNFQELLDGAEKYYNKLEPFKSPGSGIQEIRSNLADYIAFARKELYQFSNSNPVDLKAFSDAYSARANSLNAINQSFANLTGKSLDASFTEESIEDAIKKKNASKPATTSGYVGATSATASGYVSATAASLEKEKKQLLSHEEKIKRGLETLEKYPASPKKTQYVNTFNNALALISNLKKNEAVNPKDVGVSLRRTLNAFEAINDNAFELAHPRRRTASVSEAKLPTLNEAKKDFINFLDAYDKSDEDIARKVDALKQNILAVTVKLNNDNDNIIEEMNFLTNSTATSEKLTSKFANFKAAAEREVVKRIILPNLISDAEKFIQENPLHSNVDNLNGLIDEARLAIKDTKATTLITSKLIYNMRIQLLQKPAGPAPDGKDKEAIKKLKDEIDAKINADQISAKATADANAELRITKITDNIPAAKDKVKAEIASTAKKNKDDLESVAKSDNDKIKMHLHLSGPMEEINEQARVDLEKAKINTTLTHQLDLATKDEEANIKKAHINIDVNAKVETATIRIEAELESRKKIADLEAQKTILKAKVDPTTNTPEKLSEVIKNAEAVANQTKAELDKEAQLKIAEILTKAKTDITNQHAAVDAKNALDKNAATITFGAEAKKQADRILATAEAKKIEIGAGTEFEKAKATIDASKKAAIAAAKTDTEATIKLHKLPIEAKAIDDSKAADKTADDTITKKTLEEKKLASETLVNKEREAQKAADDANAAIDTKATTDKSKADADPTTAPKVKADIDAKVKLEKEKIANQRELTIEKAKIETSLKADLEIAKTTIQANTDADNSKNTININKTAELKKIELIQNTDFEIKVIEFTRDADIKILKANPDATIDKTAAEKTLRDAATAKITELQNKLDLEKKEEDTKALEIITNAKNLSGPKKDTDTLTALKNLHDEAATKLKALDEKSKKEIDEIDKKIAALVAPPKPDKPEPAKPSAIAEHIKNLDDTEIALNKASKAFREALEKISSLPFNGKRDLKDKTARFSMLIRDLRKSPNIQQRVDEVMMNVRNDLYEGDNKLLAKNPDLKAAFDHFMAASLEHLEHIKVQKEKYHATFNVEQSTIVDLDAKKTDLDTYNENKSKVGIKTGSVSDGAVVDLMSGSKSNNPSVAERLNSNQMRICAFKTSSDEMLGYVETFKMNTARSAIYEMPPSLLSVESLLKANITDKRDALGIPDSISNAQLNALFKQMLPLMTSKTFESESKIKDIIKAGLNQLGVNLPKEQYNIIANAIHASYANQQQTFNKVNLPSDDLIRLAISQINGIKQTRPDQPIHINKAPSPDYVRAIMLFANVNGYPVSNNSAFNKQPPLTKTEIEAFKLLVHTNRLDLNKNRFGAETKAPAQQHNEALNNLNKR